MRVFESQYNGELCVQYHAGYEHHPLAKLTEVHTGQMIVVMTAQEFERFRRRML